MPVLAVGVVGHVRLVGGVVAVIGILSSPAARISRTSSSVICGGLAFLAGHVRGDLPFQFGQDDVDVHAAASARSGGSGGCLVLAPRNESDRPQNAIRAQCCQFIPNDAIDGLVTRTRMLPSANPSSASAFSSGVIDPCTLTAPGISFASRSASALSPHQSDPRLTRLGGDQFGRLLAPGLRAWLCGSRPAADPAEVGGEQLAVRRRRPRAAGAASSPAGQDVPVVGAADVRRASERDRP